MLKYQLIQTYELLLLILGFSKDIYTSAKPQLRLLAQRLDRYYSGTGFIKLFENLSENAPQYGLIEDELFIDFKKLDLNYTNLEVMTERDRLLIYAGITCWIRQLELKFEDAGLLARILSVDKEFASIIEDFFNNRIKNLKAIMN